jgi:organic hydroperoxide reductase OsmC/OhrA
MDKINPLFAATATAKGGRNGHTAASDGSVAGDLPCSQATRNNVNVAFEVVGH